MIKEEPGLMFKVGTHPSSQGMEHLNLEVQWGKGPGLQVSPLSATKQLADHKGSLASISISKKGLKVSLSQRIHHNIRASLHIIQLCLPPPLKYEVRRSHGKSRFILIFFLGTGADAPIACGKESLHELECLALKVSIWSHTSVNSEH